MDFLRKNAVAILGGIILLCGIYVYVTYFSGGSSSATLTASSDADSTTQSLLLALQSLHTIKLDDSIFSAPAFQSLNDFGVTLPQGTYGRRDPFLPVGGAGAGASSAGGVQIQLPSAH